MPIKALISELELSPQLLDLSFQLLDLFQEHLGLALTDGLGLLYFTNTGRFLNWFSRFLPQLPSLSVVFPEAKGKRIKEMA